jgi:hypothetical protein
MLQDVAVANSSRYELVAVVYHAAQPAYAIVRIILEVVVNRTEARRHALMMRAGAGRVEMEEVGRNAGRETAKKRGEKKEGERERERERERK